MAMKSFLKFVPISRMIHKTSFRGSPHWVYEKKGILSIRTFMLSFLRIRQDLYGDDRPEPRLRIDKVTQREEKMVLNTETLLLYW